MNENLTQAVIALHKSASSIVADAELTDVEKQELLDESFQQYHQHVFEKVLKADDTDDADEGDGAEITKETEMLHDPIEVAKRVIAGAPTRITKSGWYAEISARAEADRGEGESEAQAFTRYITKHEDGRTLYQAYKRALPDEPTVDAVTPAPMPAPTRSYQRLMAKAEELRKSEPKLSEAQAFAKVYESRENRELVDASKSEHAERALSTGASSTMVAKGHDSAGDRLARCAAALVRQHKDLSHADAFQHAKERNPELAAAYERETGRAAA
jgi:hypothetical protein